MNRSRTLVVAPVIACLLALAGCSSSPAADPATSPSASPSASASSSTADGQEILAPVSMTPEQLDGQDVTITPQIPLVLRVPEGAEADWQATVETPDVASFVAGTVTDSAT